MCGNYYISLKSIRLSEVSKDSKKSPDVRAPPGETVETDPAYSIERERSAAGLWWEGEEGRERVRNEGRKMNKGGLRLRHVRGLPTAKEAAYIIITWAGGRDRLLAALTRDR